MTKYRDKPSRLTRRAQGAGLRLFAIALAAAIWGGLGIYPAGFVTVQARPGDSLRAKVAGQAAPFQDCETCPLMVAVPAGAFEMGSLQGKPAEQPVRQVSISRPFAMSVYEITFAEYETCVAGGACAKTPDDHDWGRGQRPVINISWAEANDYVLYLSQVTGEIYRLPSEAEWEYAARAGTTSAFWWGDEAGDNVANCRKCGSEWDGKASAPVGSFPANPFSLHDMNGNVWEWTSDCWNPNHDGAPADGAARQSGDCGRRVIRSGSWYYIPRLMSAHARDSHSAQLWSYNIGIRVVRELP